MSLSLTQGDGSWLGVGRVGSRHSCLFLLGPFSFSPFVVALLLMPTIPYGTGRKGQVGTEVIPEVDKVMEELNQLESYTGIRIGHEKASFGVNL